MTEKQTFQLTTSQAIVLAGLIIGAGVYFSQKGLPNLNSQTATAPSAKKATELFKDYAKDLGLNLNQFNSCLDSGKYAQQIGADVEAGTKAGVSGTPSFFINGRILVGAVPIEEFKKLIEEELTQTAPGETQRVQIEEVSRPSLGDNQAEVKIVEFTDFQCPFCKRADEATFPTLKQDYIDTGRVGYVVRDFPLTFHPHAQKAAEATHCAEEQNKYWEMHDKLFEQQSEWEKATT